MPKPHKQPSTLSETLKEKRTVREAQRTNCFVVSFKDLSNDQGDTLNDWARLGLLETLINVLKGYCSSPLRAQRDGKKFAIYGDFPKNSDFTHPKGIPEDAEWARIHLGGKEVLAGHVVDNTFYAVFLDGNHGFFKISK